MTTDIDNLFKDKVLGHPAGLFVLFFTEMWERFSFYGMRVLLVNFLTFSVIGDNPGWGWSAENATALFGTYAMLLYITPIIGGIIADKLTGYKLAVIIGSVIMAMGHASMAIETEFSLYFGLGLLVVGTGFFKPNITSIISEMYKTHPEKKDGAYTIFYMGVNAGAFFGMMLCGYLAEKVGWSYGFGLAGIFMLLGTLQFAFSGNLFGEIGKKPSKVHEIEDVQDADNSIAEVSEDEEIEKENPFTVLDKVLIVISSVIGLGYALNDPMSKIANIDMFSAFQIGGIEGQYVVVLIGLILFLYLVISRILRYSTVVRDRMLAFIIFAFFTVFFWLSFEQGASSLVLFARDNVDRVLTGNSAFVFNIINALLTVIPLAIITYVLYDLWKKTYKKIPYSNIVLAICFLLMWAIVGWMLSREFTAEVSEITVSWFSILNSFFIIVFASFFSKWWESKYNPSAAAKYAYGLIIMAIGFGLLAFGAYGIQEGVKVSMIWLILAYLFHTLGELCLSPVGLSYVSKLVPARMIALMFGMWYLAIAIGNKLAAVLGGQIENITKAYSLSTFFLIFTIVPVVAGLFILVLNPLLKKLMHGVK
ncbi:peptide MFS transporter [Formosa algae]|uniref:POT family proton-dependent oligopeptide transporter n=1 Tax=Formosa algae TaxID=225843 RepID=A0A9X1CBG7_9FLAO|nr:peptide MFS transporter [Formosa algae]MBP1839195.1 POT family proton-dependent oligopeptide transporter [Formosa algae]MDQ0333972.1 POT family proton-dependent oligopeptide transporter [Formosa algae]OEI79703.1 amino acid permease [Formosa algae]PNW27596.1 MFS transporter [Formosa algae]